MAYTPDGELDKDYLTTDTTQIITGNKTFDGSLIVNSSSPFYVKNNIIRFDTNGAQLGSIGTSGLGNVRIDVDNNAELLTNNTPASADSITNKAYVDGEISALNLDSVLTQGNTSNQDATFGGVNVGDVLNLASTTNNPATNGDIWYDGTNLRLKGDLGVSDNISLTRSSSTTITRGDSTGFLSIYGDAANTGAGLLLYGSTHATNPDQGRLRIDTNTKLLWDNDSVDAQVILRANSGITANYANTNANIIARNGTSPTLYVNQNGTGDIQRWTKDSTQTVVGKLLNDGSFQTWGKVNLVSYTNSSPVNGDIWYDGTNVRIHGIVQLNSQKLYGYSYVDIVDNTGWGVRVDGSNDTLRPKNNTDDTYLGLSDYRYKKLWAVDGDFSGTSSTINSKHIVNRLSKTITLQDPTSADIIPIFRTDEALTIDKISYEVIGGTNCVFHVQYGNDAGAAGTNVTASAMIAGLTTTDTTTFSNAAIGANNYLQLNVSSISGTPDYVSVTIYYTMDANS